MAKSDTAYAKLNETAKREEADRTLAELVVRPPANQVMPSPIAVATLTATATPSGASASPPIAASTPEQQTMEVVTADESKGLNVRSAPDAKSAVVVRLHTRDRVIVGAGRIRNNEPPHPTVWQQITTMDGQTGWIAREYLSGPDSKIDTKSEEDRNVWDLFEKWMVVNTVPDPTREAALYADPVDYLDAGTISRQQLADNLRADFQKWPKQFNRISRGPEVQKIGDSEWKVTFELNFDSRNPAQVKRVTGIADLTWTVHHREGGGVEISSTKENVKTRTYHEH